MVGRWCRHRPSHQSGYLRLWVFHPPTRVHVRLLGPCFKTGPLAAFRQHPEDAARAAKRPSFLGQSRDIDFRHRKVSPAGLAHADQLLALSGTRWDALSLGAPTAANGFPLNNFKHFLTLFSKFFSSFPHGTCSLSVSRQYLVLDGTYHQIRAAFPNNPTLRKHLVKRSTPCRNWCPYDGCRFWWLYH